MVWFLGYLTLLHKFTSDYTVATKFIEHHPPISMPLTSNFEITFTA